MKKKVLILYATYGSGHKSIANYIEKYFKTVNNDIEIMSIDLLNYAIPVVGKLSKNINEFLMLKQPKLWNVIYKLSDNKFNAIISKKVGMTLFKSKKLQKIIADFNPDLTISTHFFGSPLIHSYNKKKITASKVITIVTDYEAHELWIENHKESDYLVVCSNEEKRYLTQYKNISKNKIKTFGIPIFPNENFNFDRLKSLKENNFDPRNLTCVFFAGGGNGSTTTLPYIKALLKKDLNLNLIFIAGRNEKALEKINSYKNKYEVDNCKVYGFVNNVPELLQMSDFVVTKPGGVQTTECLYFKKPMLMLRSSGGQENGNVKYFVKKGYGKMFKYPRKFVSSVEKIVGNPKNLDKMNKALSKMNNHDAMKNIYNLAMDLLK